MMQILAAKPPIPMDWVINTLMVALIVTSGLIWSQVVYLRFRHGEVLAYRPRRHVPWGPVGLVLALLFVTLKVIPLLTGEAAGEPTASALWQWLGLQCVILVGGIGMLRAVYRTTSDDLGLPPTLGEISADIALGIVAGIAAIVPVYALLLVLVAILGESAQHPLIEQLRTEPDWGFAIAVIISAVIAAPIFEEFVFRLLLQGWLEKVFDQRSATTQSEPTFPDAPLDDFSTPATPAEGAIATDVAFLKYNPPPSPKPRPPLVEEAPRVTAAWLPIMISSLLFAAAHAGYGYSPVPLFVLALILGYLYQRTHRIIPCIVVHVVFNGVSLAMLGLEIVRQAEAG